MQDLIVSMIRFSAAVTLFSMEQVQKSLNIVEGGGEDVPKSLDRIEEVLNSLTDELTSRIDEKKRETLKSITKMSEDVVGRTSDAMNVVDPREMMRATSDLIQKTSDATADWVSKAASTTESGRSSDQSTNA